MTAAVATNNNVAYSERASETRAYIVVTCQGPVVRRRRTNLDVQYQLASTLSWRPCVGNHDVAWVPAADVTTPQQIDVRVCRRLTTVDRLQQQPVHCTVLRACPACRYYLAVQKAYTYRQKAAVTHSLTHGRRYNAQVDARTRRKRNY